MKYIPARERNNIKCKNLTIWWNSFEDRQHEKYSQSNVNIEKTLKHGNTDPIAALVTKSVLLNKTIAAL